MVINHLQVMGWSSKIGKTRLKVKLLVGPTFVKSKSRLSNSKFGEIFSGMFGDHRLPMCDESTETHLANGPWKESLNFIFPTIWNPQKFKRLAIG